MIVEWLEISRITNVIYQLEKEKYGVVRDIFEPLERYQPMCSAVLACIYPGRIYVDNVENPETAFLTSFISSKEEGVWGYLTGDPNNHDFNQSLNAAICAREIIHVGSPVMFLTCSPQEWGGHLESVITPYQPVPAPRRHYVGREMSFDWRSNIPEGFEICPMDERLMERSNLSIPIEVHETIEKWGAINDPRFEDYGFVAIHQSRWSAQIVSWATVDFIVGSLGDAGLFTVEGFRRRGLASVTTGAAVEYGFVHGLTKINWTCSDDNIASIRTAEKLGFERQPNYLMYYIFFDTDNH